MHFAEVTFEENSLAWRVEWEDELVWRRWALAEDQNVGEVLEVWKSHRMTKGNYQNIAKGRPDSGVEQWGCIAFGNEHLVILYDSLLHLNTLEGSAVAQEQVVERWQVRHVGFDIAELRFVEVLKNNRWIVFIMIIDE